MSAAITVFALSELVEQILYHATLANILRSQRVNTTFKRVIDETPRLQEKLFFRAIRPYDSKGNEVEAKCNEVLLQAFGDLQYYSLKHTIKSKTTTDVRYVTDQDFRLHFTCPKDRRKTLKLGSWQRIATESPSA